MRDKNVRKAKFFLQILHQVHNLRLDGNVERANGLVGNDDFRRSWLALARCQLLPLPAGKFVRVTISLLRASGPTLLE